MAKTMEAIIGLGGKVMPSLKAAIKSAQTTLGGVGKGSNAGSKALSAMGKAGKAALVGIGAAAGAATVAVGKIAKDALDAYASYEQLVGGVDTLFGESSQTVQDYAANAYKTAGMSANQYMETITGFSASLLQSLGGDTAAAAEMGNMAVTDMSDNANKMGSNIEDIQRAYQSLARGQYGMLDNLKLGYGGTKSEMERLIADANKLREANGQAGDLSIDKFGDVVQAIHEVQTEMGITGTTAKEASTTIEGSVNSAKAAWTNWLTALGNENADLEGVTDQLVESVITAAKNIIPRVMQILKSLGTAIRDYLPDILDGVSGLIPDLLGAILPPDMAAQVVPLVQELMGTISSCIGQIMPMISQLAATLLPIITQLITSLLPPLISIIGQIIPPIMEIISAVLPPLISLISSLLPLVMQIISAILPPLVQFIQMLIPPIMQILNAILPPLISIISSLMPVIQSVLNVIITLLNTAIIPLLDPIMQLVNALLPPIAGLIQGIMPVVQGAIGVINALAGALSPVVSFLGSIIDLAGQAASAIGGLFSGGLDFIGGLFGFAEGGFTNGLAFVGEDPRYPTEAVISFNPAYRAQNIRYLKMAGHMLGLSSNVFSEDANPGQWSRGASLVASGEGSGYLAANIQTSTTIDVGGITFAPTINIQGNADKDDIIAALREVEPEFRDLIADVMASNEVGNYAFDI